MVYHPDGSQVVQFVDGTRCTISPEANEAYPPFLIECPGLASLASNPCKGTCTLTLADGTVVLCSNDGNYVVEKDGKCHLDINTVGKASCSTNSGGQYTFEYTGTNSILHARDHMDNDIKIDCEGQASVDDKNPPTATTENPYMPKLFLVDSDDKCAELLKDDCVASVISTAQTDPHSAVIQTDIPGDGVFSTILKPFYEKDCKSSAYTESEIVPLNIRDECIKRVRPDVTYKYRTSRFGVSVGRGMMIGTWNNRELQESIHNPGLIISSQFLQRKQVSDRTRQKLLSTMMSFNEFCKDKVVEDNHCIKSTCENSDTNPNGILRCGLVTRQDSMYSLYDKTFQKIEEEAVQSKYQPCLFHNEAENIKRQHELHAFKTACRQKDIPPYSFKLPKCISSPDMEMLTSKLSRVCDPDLQQTQSLKPVFSETTSEMFSLNVPTHPSDHPPENDTQRLHPTDIHSKGNIVRPVTGYTTESSGESKGLTYQDESSPLFNKSIKVYISNK